MAVVSTGLPECGLSRIQLILFGLSLVEGVATVGIALLCIFVLPDVPQKAKLLSLREKDRLIYRLQMDRGQKDNSSEISAFKGFKMAVCDPKTWLLCGILTSTWVAGCYESSFL